MRCKQMTRKAALMIIDTRTVDDLREIKYWRIADRLFRSGYDVEIYRAKDTLAIWQCAYNHGSHKDVILCCGDDGDFHEVTTHLQTANPQSVVCHIPVRKIANMACLPAVILNIASWLRSLSVQYSLAFVGP